jgi:hypothetical protein
VDEARAIEKAIYLYAEAVDEANFAAIGQMFVDASFAVATLDGTVVASTEGGEKTEAFFRGAVRLHGGRPLVRHVITNLVIDSGGGSATARATFTVFQGLSDFPLQPITGGRYYWRFVGAQDSWSINSLHIVIEFTGDGSRHNRG